MKNKKITAIIIIVLIICISTGLFFAFKHEKQNETTAAQTETITAESFTVPAEYAEYYNKNNDFIG